MKVSKKDAVELQQAGEIFLDIIATLAAKPEFQKAATNLSNLLSWATNAKWINSKLKKRVAPLQLIAMGIVIGKRGGKFPFTSRQELVEPKVKAASAGR